MKAGNTNKLLSALLALGMMLSVLFPVNAMQTAAEETADIAAAVSEMLETIAADYTESQDPWVIAELAAYGKADTLTGKDSYIASAKEGDAYASHAIALTALGEDVSALELSDGTTRNMIAEMAEAPIPYITTAAYVLQAYDSAGYTVPENQPSSREALVDYFLSEQEANGGWSTQYGADTTAMILPALAPYAQTDPEVKAASEKAITWLDSIQTESGNFGASAGENANTTAMAIVALSAFGINADTDERFISETGNSALDGLLSFRTADNKFGYTDNTGANAYATEQGFRALIAWNGMVQAGEPYSVFYFGGTGDEPQTQTAAVTVRIEGVSENKLYQKNAVVEYEDTLTALDVLEAVVPEEDRDIQTGSYGAYINGLYGETANMFNEDYDGWQYTVNGETPSVGIGSCQIEDGDSLLFYYGGMSSMQPMEPEISYPKTGYATLKFQTEQTTYPEPDFQPVTETVPIAGATVTLGTGEEAVTAQTDEEGRAELKISNGTYPVQIEKYGQIEVDGKYLPLVVRLAPDAQITIKNTTGGGSSGGGSGTPSEKIDVTFALIGDSQHEEGEHEEFETWIAEKEYEVTENYTVRELFELALEETDMEYEIEGDGYVSSINGLAEFDNGPNSGWMYRVNGKHVQLPISECELEDGDEVVFHYTDDYTEEEDEEEPSRPSRPSGGSGGGSWTGTSGSNGNTNTETTDTESEPEDNETVVFEDVSGWAEEYIYDLAERGIITGKEEGRFAPQDQVTRAELTAMLARMSGDTPEEHTETGFSDVAAEEWFAGAVVWANSNQIVQGFEGRFEPNASVTREDIAVMIDRYASNVAGYTFPETNGKAEFADDAGISDYAKDAVYRLQMAGILNGRDNNCFEPQAYATREEIAKILSLFLQGLEG